MPDLESSQVSTNAMPSGIKDGSKNPGSIVSFGIKGYIKVGKGILIPEIELRSAIQDIDNITFEKWPLSHSTFPFHEKILSKPDCINVIVSKSKIITEAISFISVNFYELIG